MAIYEAKYDYCKECDSLMSFKKGDKFFVTDKNNDLGWWAARKIHSDEIGYIPSSFVEFSQESPTIADSKSSDTMSTLTKLPEKIKMDALCELTAKIQQQPNLGGYHPKYKEESLEIGNRTPPEVRSKPLVISKEQNQLQKDLKFSQRRGIHLGKPELQKTWDKFEQKKSVKEQKQEDKKNELEARFETISQKNREEEQLKEQEAKKPEFMKVNLRKAKS